MSEQKKEGSRLFQCDICHYNTLVESSYERHLTSAKHVLLTKEADAKVYCCDPCDYVTIKKSCYDRHLTTTKHKLESRIIKNSEGKLVCSNCNKVYGSRQGLWEHRKKCSSSKKSEEDAGIEEEGEKEEEDGEKEDTVPVAPPPLQNTIVFSDAATKVSSATELTCQPCTETDNNMFIPKDFILRLFKQNEELMKKIIEKDEVSRQENKELINKIVEKDEVARQENKELINKLAEKGEVSQQENKDLINKIFEMTQQQLTVTNNNITNLNTINNNQRFNLNVFLNETCKDAMNLDEFLDTIRPTFDELLVMGDVGFVSGISDIFIKRLRALDITKRPIHCTDAKRETIFLKENNVWTKDDNGHSRLNSIIEKVEYRNVVCLHQWCLDNPDAMVNNHEKNLLRDKIYLQTLLGDPKTREKVVRNIAKEVALDREAIMLQFGRK